MLHGQHPSHSVPNQGRHVESSPNVCRDHNIHQNCRDSLLEHEREIRHLRSENRDLRKSMKDNGASLVEIATPNEQIRSFSRFLNTADTVSISDVVNNLESLNSEIFQLSALIADSLVFTPNFEIQPPETSESLLRLRDKILGISLFNALRTPKSNTTLLRQVALEAVLSFRSRRIIESWCLSSPSTADHLKYVYGHFWEEGPDVTIRAWRAMTRSRFHHPNSVSWESLRLDLGFIEMVSYVLRLSGWPSPGVLQDTISTKFGPSFKILAKLSFDLNKMMGEHIISTDLYPYSIRPGARFDSDSMTDFYDTESCGKTVLCTTALGICQQEYGQQKGVVHNVVILKPKVALSGILTVKTE